MQTYWDLSEKERAQLSAAEVEKFVDAELMLKGVLKVRPLQLTEVPEMPKPDLTLYVPKQGWSRTDIGFERDVDCKDALDVGLCVSQEYVNGQTVMVARAFSTDAHVEALQCYSEDQFKMARASIEKSAAAKSANERAEREHNEALKKQDDALKGLWADWHECQEKYRKLGEIINTFGDYERTAGNAETAAKFLVKVFAPADIAEAAEWFGIEIPESHQTEEKLPPPQPDPLEMLAGF